MKLLRIDSSARSASVSRQLTAEFAELWKAIHPEGEVIERDLAAESFPTITDDWVSATRTEASERSERQRLAIASSELFIAELLAADTVVIGTPMHNYGVSWPLKAWIDQIVRIGKTVEYSQQGPRGLLREKRVVVISARGGSYAADTPRAQLDFIEPYLRAVLGFIGIRDVTFIHADNQYRAELGGPAKAAAVERVARAVSATVVASPASSPR
jgi:FMN-dependent NADH-azoreductase